MNILNIKLNLNILVAVFFTVFLFSFGFVNIKTAIAIECVLNGVISEYPPTFSECPEGTTPVGETESVGGTVKSLEELCTDNPDGTDQCCRDDVLGKDNCGIVKYLIEGINFMSAVAVLAIIASIMLGGYQYMTARDNSSQIQAAKTRIIWAIIALLIFIFMYGFLQWLVPGGVL